jgi:hypothetical protein
MSPAHDVRLVTAASTFLASNMKLPAGALGLPRRIAESVRSAVWPASSEAEYLEPHVPRGHM